MKTDLTRAILDVLGALPAHKLPPACSALGLADGTEQEVFANRRTYVLSRIDGKSEAQLLALAGDVLQRHPDFELDELLERLNPSVPFQIAEPVRRAVIRELSRQGSLSGRLDLLDFLERVWPLATLKPSDTDQASGCETAADSIRRHMVAQDDWSIVRLLDFLNISRLSDRRFARLLELVVSPLVRDEAGQKVYAAFLNEHLRLDHLELRPAGEQDGRLVFALGAFPAGGPVRNRVLAFASEKPGAKNDDCLVFDAPLPSGALLWMDLVRWWGRAHRLETHDIEASRTLYKRLSQSLASPGAKALFYAYYARFRHLGVRMPALVPRVGAHADACSPRHTAGLQAPEPPRIDFLLLLSPFQRIVLQVDETPQPGDSGASAVALARNDRELRLAGYEVYRFAADELAGAHGEAVAVSFFQRLFVRYQFA